MTNKFTSLLLWAISSIAPSPQRRIGTSNIADKVSSATFSLLANKTPGRRNFIVPLTIVIGLGMVPIILEISSLTTIMGRLKDSAATGQRASASFFLSLASYMRSVLHNPPGIDYTESCPKKTSALESGATSDTLTDNPASSQENSATDVPAKRTQPAQPKQGYRSVQENEMLAHWLTAWIMDHFEGFYEPSSEIHVHLAAKIYNAIRANKGLNPPTAVVCASAFYMQRFRHLAYGHEFRDEKEMSAVPKEWGPEARCDCKAEMLFKWWLVSLHLAQMWWRGKGYSLKMMHSWTAIPLDLFRLMELRALEEFGFTTLSFSFELSNEEEWTEHFNRIEDHLLDICGWDQPGSGKRKDWEMYNTVHPLFLDIRYVSRPVTSKPWICKCFCESPLPMSPCSSSDSISSPPTPPKSTIGQLSCVSSSVSASSSSYFSAHESLPELEAKHVSFESCPASVDESSPRRDYPRSTCIEGDAGLTGHQQEEQNSSQVGCCHLARTHRQVGLNTRGGGETAVKSMVTSEKCSERDDEDRDDREPGHDGDYDGDDELEGISMQTNRKFFV